MTKDELIEQIKTLSPEQFILFRGFLKTLCTPPLFSSHPVKGSQDPVGSHRMPDPEYTPDSVRPFRPSDTPE